MWTGANMLHCINFHPADGTSWTDTCQWSEAALTHLPEVLKHYPADSDQNTFSLFRTLVYKEADQTYAPVLGSAQSSINAIHVNFSLELICMANVIVEDLWSYDNALPWMEAIMAAVEQNQVKVRVHAKTALIDQELLILGSQNFHYSSWGEKGLNEYSVATDDSEAITLYQNSAQNIKHTASSHVETV